MKPLRKVKIRARKPWTDAARILRELVAHPSVHPEADSGGTRPGEAAVADWVAARLRECGADVRLAPLAPGRPSVLAVFAPVGKADATVILAPHLDTVGVAGMTVPPFAMTRRGEKLHGRGACDTKGPMATLLAALARWSRTSSSVKGCRVRWVVAATAGEEQGSLGARQLMRDGLRGDFAVALEPTDLRVVSAAKGFLRLWIDVPGRAAHGARPERGVNAVFRAVPLLQVLETEVMPWLGRHRHPQLGGASLNLGIVHGGGELNRVPDRCRLGLDIRLHPELPVEAVLRRLGETVKRVAPRAEVRVHSTGPAFAGSRREPWARRLQAAGRGWAVADWFSDANVFADQGVPAVAFGPGRIAQAHTKDEYIEQAQLDAGTAAFLSFLQSEH